MENSRKYEQDRIQKEHEKEQEYLKTAYEKNKEKIEQIREIIIQNSLEGKLEGTISLPLTFISGEDNSEGVCVIKWLKSISVNLSFNADHFSQIPDFYPKMGSVAKHFNYRFQE